MSALRAIGFWRDPESGADRYRHPIAFVDLMWDPAERRLVADHLRSGARTTSYMGYSWCRFRCGVDDAEMGPSEFSDGVWVWPEGLVHYVLEHAVRPPEEFLRHIRDAARDPDRKLEVVGDLHPYDYEFWISWSNEHADPASGFKALEQSERESVVQRRLVDAPKYEEEFGIGTEACSEPGCEQRVLRGFDRCAWHVAGGDS